jgi:hypothetical protein
MWRQILVKQACGSPVYIHIAPRSNVFKVYRTARMVNRYLVACSAACISRHYEYQALRLPFLPLFFFFLSITTIFSSSSMALLSLKLCLSFLVILADSCLS